jgi:uncharacterized RDD family membrane protein YckC
METIQIETGQNVKIEYQIAGVGSRVLSGLIDIILLTAIGSVILYFVFNIGLGFFTVSSLLAFVLLAYAPLFELFLDGASLGKKALGLQVIKLNGAKLSAGDSILRSFLAILEIFLCYGAIATLVVIFSKKGQRLGDMAAGTTVVKVKSMSNLKNPIKGTWKVEDDYVPVFTNALLLNDADIDLCKRSVSAFTVHRDTESMKMAKAMVEAKLGLSSDYDDAKFLITLQKDFHYLSNKAEERRLQGITTSREQEPSS